MRLDSTQSCDTVELGFTCQADISHSWGQYSPYFAVNPDTIVIPSDCEIMFVQVLSRHGARYPTKSKSEAYSQLIKRIQDTATAFHSEYAFLEQYKYQLGTDDLTIFGQNQMAKSGIKFYNQYQSLARNHVPFIRASGSDRVVASAEFFIHGFRDTKSKDASANKTNAPPQVDVVIWEGHGFNNTLDSGNCPAFDDHTEGKDARARFLMAFAPRILERILDNLPEADLSTADIPYLMDLCPFETVAYDGLGIHDKISSFCALFTLDEWRWYDYYQTLDKYYGHGAGDSLGATQGIGFVNELIARMTNTAVEDQTTVNHTLDFDPGTFPLGLPLYVDFSHDNTMTSIFTALGLYNSTKPLSTTRPQSIEETNGYSAAWTVPFAARAYIEMMQCPSQGTEPLVRILVNDRVVPLHGCTVDRLGRCSRSDFVRGLSFARTGGNWDSCND